MPQRYLLCLLLTYLFSTQLFANDYEDAWKALDHNDRKTARELLLKAMNDPHTAVDAYITYIYLEGFEGKESAMNDFIPRLYNQLKDPSPYIFSLWFNEAALGSYGQKKDHQLELLDRLMADTMVNGSIRTAAHYFKGLHYRFGNDMADAAKEWAKMGAVDACWQLAGPFDNLSGSGYYKDYGPLGHPEADARFSSFNNAMVTWFTPAFMSHEGYTFPYNYLRRSSAVVYAQTFVYSPDDRRVLLNAGVGGSIRVWINDRPVLAASKELVTELDFYRQPVQLKKGYNRLLVQLGYSSTNSPNFIIRFTDDRYNAMGDLTYSAATQAYTKETSMTEAPPSLKHFAEDYFEKKVAAEPGNYVNYVLLADTYLRSNKVMEARKLIGTALNQSPDNPLLRLELMEILIKENNRTLLLEEAMRMKDKDPDCLIAIRMNIQQLIREEKYDEAFKELDRCTQLYGEDVEASSVRMTLYSKQNKMDELVKAIQAAYDKYPDNADMVQWMYSLKVNGYKDDKAGIKVLEAYLEKHFNYKLLKTLTEEYTKEGEKEKALALLEASKNAFPFDPELYTDISSYYYTQADYARAADFGRQALKQAPYVATYWGNLGLELQQAHQDSDAEHAYRQALYYDATDYSAREHLRDLEKKPSLWKAFPQTDVYKAIKDSAGKTYDYDYCYLLDEKFAIVYAEGATEEYTTAVVRILDQKGIDDWKEYNIGYNSNTQVLKIEKAEVVKKSGSVMPAEQNDNQIVFTGLETGDAIVLKYKIQNYADGRVTRHYWDRFGFNGFKPEDTARYCLLVSNKVKFDYKMDNAVLKPRQAPYDDFTLYTWEMDNPAVTRDEPYMPPSMDVGPTLSISTLASWQDISGWYSDLATSKTDDDYEVKTVFGNLFPEGTDKLTDREKAFRIYKYITANIHYSSVSFRQGAFVPQKASVTINTRLGDCKDLSSLFVSLARLSGLKADLVLVNTRDNGLKSMELPSLEFNHCIVKTWMDGKAYFLELTDNNLPFAALPTSLMHATCLVIPTGEGAIADSAAIAGNAKLEFVESPLRPRDKAIRRVDLHVEGSNLKMGVDVSRTGTLISAIRDDFGELSPEKQLEKIQTLVSGGFKNTVKVGNVSLRGIKESGDSAGYSYSATVDNEVVEVGDMHMIKIPFTDMVATVDDFSRDDRQFPVEYWRYESADEYDTKITVEVPVGRHFIELPKNETYTFRNSTYSLQYIPSGTRKLTIIRKATLQRDDVTPAEYKAMREFFGKIVKAESKYIVYR